VDQGGGSLNATRIELGTGGAPYALVAGIRTAGRIVFAHIGTQASIFPRLYFAYETGNRGPQGCGFITFHNLPVPDHAGGPSSTRGGDVAGTGATKLPQLPEKVPSHVPASTSNPLAGSQQAQSGGDEGPANFEVANVKLRMTGKEAVAALERKYGLKAKRITDDPSNYFSVDSLVYVASKTKYRSTPGYYISNIRYRNNESGVRVIVDLKENYPYDPAQPEIVTRVNYQFDTVTDTDKRAFIEQAVKHYTDLYGPAYVDPSLWCTLSPGIPRKVHGPPVDCDPDRARFQIDGGNLELSDPSIGWAITTLWNKRRVVTATPDY
jgi:hypothetical protein